MIEPIGFETVEELPLLFVHRTGNYETSAGQAWKALFAFLAEKKINPKEMRLISVAHDDPEVTDEKHLRFDACFVGNLEPEGEIGVQKAQGRYAIFEHKGSYETIIQTCDQIALTWLPTSHESYDDARFGLCEHLNMDAPDEEKVTKIYLPVQSKKRERKSLSRKGWVLEKSL